MLSWYINSRPVTSDLSFYISANISLNSKSKIYVRLVHGCLFSAQKIPTPLHVLFYCLNRHSFSTWPLCLSLLCYKIRVSVSSLSKDQSSEAMFCLVSSALKIQKRPADGRSTAFFSGSKSWLSFSAFKSPMKSIHDWVALLYSQNTKSPRQCRRCFLSVLSKSAATSLVPVQNQESQVQALCFACSGVLKNNISGTKTCSGFFLFFFSLPQKHSLAS